MPNKPDLTFQLEPNPELPRLAWCAQITKNQPTAIVKCGPWVESIPNGFTAGAWDREYTEGRPDLALTLIGSAGLTTEEGFLFCPASHTLEWLLMVRVGDTQYISNSLPMLLAETDDEPDINYPDYIFDLLDMFRDGLSAAPRCFPTARARQVQPILYRNLLVQADLKLRLIDKDPGPVPISFESYHEFLQKSVTSVSRNATNTTRKHPFSLRCTVSSGYDSTATAVLTANAGCKQALCFTASGDAVRWGPDSGKAVSEQLDMSAHEYSRDDLLKWGGLRDDEFYINPLRAPTDRCFLVFTDQLESAVLATGYGGGIFLTQKATHGQPELKEYWADYIQGGTFIEYSLRKGFLHFPVLYIGARHAPTIKKIAKSKHMKPWRIGGRYDRPIQRRIAEEAGIPRSLFGVHKRGGGKTRLTQNMSQESLDDFNQYLASLGSRIPRPIPQRILNIRQALHQIEKKFRHRPYIGYIFKIIIGDRLNPLWRNQRSYSFHWGLTRMCKKYDVALKK